MSMKVVLPSQAESGLGAKQSLSNSAQGDGEKSVSFLQILRPKPGLTGKAEPSSRGKTASKTIVSPETLRRTPHANPTTKAGEDSKGISGKSMTNGSQAKGQKKQKNNDFTLLAVPHVQTLQQANSTTNTIILKKQPGTTAGNLVKAAQSGQVKKGSRNPVANKADGSLYLDNRNNPQVIERAKVAFPRSIAERKSVAQLSESASELIQSKRSSGVFVTQRPAYSDVGNGSRNAMLSGVTSGKASAVVKRERIDTAAIERINKADTKAGVSVSAAKAVKQTIAAERSRSYGNSAVTKLTNPARTQQPSTKAKGGSLEYAQAKGSEKIESLGQATRGSSVQSRLEKAGVAPKPRLTTEGIQLGVGAKKSTYKKDAEIVQNLQRLGRPASVQPSELEVYGAKNKFSSTSASDDQSLAARQATVDFTRERILKTRMPTADTAPDILKESIRPINVSRVQEQIVEALSNPIRQMSGLQAVASKKSNFILDARVAKKATGVTSRLSQRLRELAGAATAKKSPKPLMPHAKVDKGVFKSLSGGMEDAFLKSDMNLPRKMEQTGDSRQNLPFGRQPASGEAGKHASVAAEMIEAGRSDLSHIRDITIRNDFANRLNQADVELQSLQAKTTQSKGQSSANAVMYRQVMSAVETFRGMNTTRWAMTIEPFSDLRMQLDLRMSDARLVVQAKLERGNPNVIGNGWSELQASLAEKDVDLRSLTSAGPKEGHSNMFGGKNERQPGGAKQDDETWFSEELSELLAEFEKEAQVQGKAKRNGKKARMPETTFESWA